MDILPEPTKGVPAIFTAVANFVAVSANVAVGIL